MILFSKVSFRFVLVVTAAFFHSLISAAPKYQLDVDPKLSPTFQIDTAALCNVANSTRHYLTEHTTDNFAVHAGAVFPKALTLARVKKTLDFICRINDEDTQKKQSSRLKDIEFIKQSFDFYHWSPDKKTASDIANKSTNAVKSKLLRNIPADKILLTKYYTKLLEGSEVKTKKYTQALYALPFDEQGITVEQAERKAKSLTRYKYTRQEVTRGVLEENQLAKPLIWLTEEALHDVLLQGTGVLNVDGKTRYFNVHRNNGIAYDYAIGKREQARYWYFSEVPSILGYGTDIDNKIPIKSHVSFAGNVAELGLGKLIMINYSQVDNGKAAEVSRMGVLADQGGAFDNNLFQLDFLVDSYKGWTDYYQANKHLPDYAKAWVVVLKTENNH